MFHELERHTAASLLIDPETGLPPGVTPEGHHVPPSPEAIARSRRRLLCQSCLNDVAAGRAVTFSVRLKGEQTAAAVTSEAPVVDDAGQEKAVRCPASGCGALVDLVDGRLDRHFMLGLLSQECHTSGVPVMIGES